MTAPKPTVVNPAHWLDDGDLPAGPPELRARALRMAQCIESGGPLARGLSRETLIPCLAHTDGLPCLGLLVVLKQKDDAIFVFCPVCTHDEFMIYEWEDTLWASGPAEPLDVAAVAAEYGLTSERTPKPGDRDEMLARVLALVGCPWQPAEVRRRLASATVPSQVVQQIVDSCPVAPAIASLERLLPVLFDTWNDMQASAPTAQQPRTRTKVGVNTPCPCGSGKKYKRCCMLRESVH